ncbi:hypothetical protein ACIRQP_40070 [Streptomyces sp. NPDC102274]|uniref:hypothetical protein n=1 Tax=Streptomyces sp. NPDC102274 TaxID=3366151 RepID=UPI00382593CF
MEAQEVDRAVDFILAVHRDDKARIKEMTQTWRFLAERPIRLVLADLAPLAIGALETLRHAGMDGNRFREEGIDTKRVASSPRHSGPGHLGNVLGTALQTWGRVSADKETPIGIARAILAYLQPPGVSENTTLTMLELLRSSLKSPDQKKV